MESEPCIHEPDWDSVRAIHDDGEVSVDVCCCKCGASWEVGCGKVDGGEVDWYA